MYLNYIALYVFEVTSAFLNKQFINSVWQKGAEENVLTEEWKRKVYGKNFVIKSLKFRNLCH